MNKLLYILFLYGIVLILFNSCSRIISTACPEPILYSDDFIDNLKKDLTKETSYFIKQIVIDNFNTQENLKKCNGVK